MKATKTRGSNNLWARIAPTRRRRELVAAMGVATSIALLTMAAPAPGQTSGGTQPRVLRVGTYRGMRGDFSTIQDAVDNAQPGDWVLIAPGDYHEQGDHRGPGPATDAQGGVMITTPGIHIRGLDRNNVIVDGTKPGSRPCDKSAAAQDPGPSDADGNPVGRNGIEVFEVDGVSIENLTVCNFLSAGDSGNEIWWNGGDGTGTINIGPYHGAYLTATSTYYGGPDQPAGEYGIFVSNSSGPGLLEHTYASNMHDSSYYIGACADCDVVVDDAHAQGSALGYSGTNSGGHLILQNSEWDNNKTGISMNSQNNDDAPSPQDGACPGDETGPTGSASCTLIRNNYIHNNGNPNVPEQGSAALGPVGTGIVLSGGRNDTVIGNRIEDEGSWGVLVVPFIDSGPPPPIAHCDGGTLESDGVTCYYDSWGHEVTGNTFKNVGFYGNASNGDLADLSSVHDPGNCWHDNVDQSGSVSSAPDGLQSTHATCGVPNSGDDLSSDLAAQVICATEIFGPCPDQPGMHYPRSTQVYLVPLLPQRTMPDPCADVPANPWCKKTPPPLLPNRSRVRAS